MVAMWPMTHVGRSVCSLGWLHAFLRFGCASRVQGVQGVQGGVGRVDVDGTPGTWLWLSCDCGIFPRTLSSSFLIPCLRIRSHTMPSNNQSFPPLPQTQFCLLSSPDPHILLIVINRPKQLNALSLEASWELSRVFDWAEEQSDVWVVVITGAGEKAFCAGMDLKSAQASQGTQSAFNRQDAMPPTGFGGISRRNDARKPVVAAVNGFAMGGGMEILLACDIVVASQKAIFGLPEVKRGVYAAMGGIARIARSTTYQRAAEIALTGRHFTAAEAREFGFVNEVVSRHEDVLPRALAWAKMITEASPDSVQLTKQGLLLALETGSLSDATKRLMESPEAEAWSKSENLGEGLQAFVEKRKPVWKNPKSKL